MPFDIIRALRARGKSDALAQLAADEIERLRQSAVPAPTPAPRPDGFIITEQIMDKARELKKDLLAGMARTARQQAEEAKPVVLTGDEAEALARITNDARAKLQAEFLAKLARHVELDDRPFGGTPVNESAMWREMYSKPATKKAPAKKTTAKRK